MNLTHAWLRRRPFVRIKGDDEIWVLSWDVRKVMNEVRGQVFTQTDGIYVEKAYLMNLTNVCEEVRYERDRQTWAAMMGMGMRFPVRVSPARRSWRHWEEMESQFQLIVRPAKEELLLHTFTCLP